jgi:hypothetical protein
MRLYVTPKGYGEGVLKILVATSHPRIMTASQIGAWPPYWSPWFRCRGVYAQVVVQEAQRPEELAPSSPM